MANSKDRSSDPAMGSRDKIAIESALSMFKVNDGELQSKKEDLEVLKKKNQNQTNL